jgi:hypothetical protein
MSAPLETTPLHDESLWTWLVQIIQTISGILQKLKVQAFPYTQTLVEFNLHILQDGIQAIHEFQSWVQPESWEPISTPNALRNTSGYWISIISEQLLIVSIYIYITCFPPSSGIDNLKMDRSFSVG